MRGGRNVLLVHMAFVSSTHMRSNHYPDSILCLTGNLRNFRCIGRSYRYVLGKKS